MNGINLLVDVVAKRGLARGVADVEDAGVATPDVLLVARAKATSKTPPAADALTPARDIGGRPLVAAGGCCDPALLTLTRLHSEDLAAAAAAETLAAPSGATVLGTLKRLQSPT